MLRSIEVFFRTDYEFRGSRAVSPEEEKEGFAERKILSLG